MDILLASTMLAALADCCSSRGVSVALPAFVLGSCIVCGNSRPPLAEASWMEM